MADKPELRMALAMRGGVSLAVWMGGACSEINALREATPDAGPTASLYSKLLAASGYSGVTVDVVAGASAGGLNGALIGCSIVHGMPFESNIRNLWLQLGDIGRLARPGSLRPAPSILDGDKAFFAPLCEQMLALVNQAAPPTEAVRLDLTLTGTLYDPQPTTRYQDLGRAIQESRHRARFRFRHIAIPGEELLCDFGSSADRDAALQRLAYAARATSSFPGAFEPASVGFTEDANPPAGSPELPATHYGVYSESRDAAPGGVERDFIIDGGVLDNIPVAWAVRSIAAAPADHSVHRWLVYLQPVPFPLLPRAGMRRPDMRATVKRARRLRSETETLSDDIDEMQRLQRERLNQEGSRQIVEYALGEQQSDESDEEFLRGLFKRALTATGQYRQRLGNVEASRLRQLWADPLPVLGADPLGFEQLRWINKQGEEPSEPSELSQLLRQLASDPSLPDAVLPTDAADDAESSSDAELATQTAALVQVGRRIRTPQALARTVAALLDSARDLGDAGLELKGHLYDLRSRIELLIAWHDRQLAAEPFKSTGTEPIEVARRAARRLRDSQSDLSNVAPVAADWPDEPFDPYWDELVALAAELEQVALPPPRALLSCLMSAADEADRSARMEAVLVATELLTGPWRPDPLSESTRIRFHMLSALNSSPLAVLQPDGMPLRIDEKLAGNQLANFGAFLSARWRQNDWTWGRLDAAKSLVDILTQPYSDDAAGGVRPEPDWPALRELAGLAADASNSEVVDALVAALHTRILQEELPLFGGLGGAPPNANKIQNTAPLRGPIDAAAVRPLLRTGRETVWSVVAKDPLRMPIALRLAEVGLLGWASGTGRFVATGPASRASRAASSALRGVGAVGRRVGQGLRNAGNTIRRWLPF